MMLTFEDARTRALTLAHDADDAADAVVARAEAYLAFLVPAPVAAPDAAAAHAPPDQPAAANEAPATVAPDPDLARAATDPAAPAATAPAA